MSSKDYDGAPNDELEKRFPDLARARNLVIQLFQTPAPLVTLGYGSDLSRAMNILSLATEAGEVLTYIKNYPFLYIEQQTRSSDDSLQISFLPSKRGFEVEAFQEKAGHGFGAEALLKDLMSMELGGEVFPEAPGLFAHIGLFSSAVNLDNLKFLVNDLKGGFLYDDLLLGLRERNPLTSLAAQMGLAATYHAAWIDEKRKQEFVVAIEYPKNIDLEPAFIGYKKLPAISDSKGVVWPIGKRPNLSRSMVMKVLQRSRVLSGRLVLEH